MFGAGGTLAELIRDRNLWVLPIAKNEIKNVVERSKISRLLKGYRGDSPYAFEWLYDVIEKIVNLAENNKDLKEIDMNPVIVTHEAALAVDGKIIL